MVDEVRVNAMLSALQQQRDQAMNAVVNLSADLVIANNKIEELEKKLKELSNGTDESK